MLIWKEENKKSEQGRQNGCRKTEDNESLVNEYSKNNMQLRILAMHPIVKKRHEDRPQVF